MSAQSEIACCWIYWGLDFAQLHIHFSIYMLAVINSRVIAFIIELFTYLAQWAEICLTEFF